LRLLDSGPDERGADALALPDGEHREWTEHEHVDERRPRVHPGPVQLHVPHDPPAVHRDQTRPGRAGVVQCPQQLGHVSARLLLERGAEPDGRKPAVPSQRDTLNVVYESIRAGARRGLSQNRAEDERLDGRIVTIEGRRLLHFGSCSYLGRETHPALTAGVVEAVNRYGTQFASSRA
jgi:hypothetical protein